MPKKYYLDVSDDWDFQMIGISTTIRDFRLAYYLNKFTNLNLCRSEAFPAEIQGVDEPCEFAFYLSEEIHSQLGFYMIANRSSDYYLIPDQKQADFFLIIKGSYPQESLTKIVKTIRQIPNVSTAYPINIRSDKKIEAFLTEFELHTLSIRKKEKIKE